MKVRYESDDGLVSGYGDEGKAAVEAHEADPLSRFLLPWTYCGAGVWVRNNGGHPPAEQFATMCLLGSRLAPLVKELVKSCVDEYGFDWHEAFSSTHPTHVIMKLETALNETLNA